ncbi:MAG: SPASM domain-containing protein [Proteobacteria bacterium]|nr:SPASM domain-containing protein [Pseudomonadota bacterium]MBU4289064.1 SPASM domain-containing protein [Pseudomonadota bacterium]MBU4413728.1 SPASM domain-containing protein [Pseudomonadota bacterium]MCG2758119.1 SPASM domain-containing protein [Desulfobacteraceae bacterium]
MKKLSLATKILRNWIAYKTNLMTPVPIGYVILGITFQCNAKCSMCNIHKFHKSKAVKDELLVDQLFDKFKESSILRRISMVDITGGEPFLKEGCKTLISELFSLPNIELVSINTNGFLSDRIEDAVTDIIGKLPKGKKFVLSVSIDGVGQLHDEIRGINGAFRSVEKTILKLKTIRERFPRFAIRSNAVIQKKNINHLEEIKKFWVANGISGTFSVIQQPFYTHSRSSIYNDMRRFDKTEIDIIKEIGPKSTGMNYYLTHNFVRPLHCFAGYTSVFIDPFGTVYPCNFLCENPEYIMGSLRHYSIDEVWTSTQAQHIRGKVKRCPFTNCWNGCEVDQTMIQFYPLNRIVKILTLGYHDFYKLKGLKGFD